MRIVVGVDGGERQPDALALAGALARAQDELVVAHVYPWSPSPAARRPGAYFPVVEQDAAEIVVAARGALGRRASGRVLAARSPAGGLIDLCEQEQADLLVLGACHRGPVGRTVLGGVGDHVMHGSPCAVAVAPRGYADGPQAIGSIAVGYDDDPESHAALAWARRAAAEHGARLTVYSVVEAPLHAIYPLGAPSYAALHDEQRDRLRTRLDEAVAALPSELDAGGELLDGSAADILRTASGQHDLLVLGSRGFGPLGNVMLGGVSRSVVHHAQCPVVVLPRSATDDGADRAAVRTVHADTETAGG